MNIRGVMISAFSCVIACPQFAYGQQVASDSRRSAGGRIEEITVTAQRRAQSLQSVPLTVIAVTEDQLRSSGIASTQDLPVLTPGLTMTNARNTTTPYLRGIGTQSGTTGTEGAVAVYVDGVYLPNAVSSVFALPNVERVEVLKGPQGTLFGRNATGGLIQVITKEPSYDTEVDVSLGYGNFDNLTGSLYATTGLTDTVSANISLYRNYQGDGWGKNLHLDHDVGLRREWSVRSKIKFDLTGETSVLLGGDYTEFRSDIGNVRFTPAGSVTLGGFENVGTVYDTAMNAPFPSRPSKNYGGSVVISHQLSDSIELTSTTAYREFDVDSFTDTDATPVTLANFRLREVGDSFQQELLLNGHFGNLDWTGGLFYFQSNAGWNPLEVFASAGSPANAARFSNIRTNSYAVFGQGTYEIAQDTNLTLGVRYTEDEGEIEGHFVALEGNPAPAGTVILDTMDLAASQTRRKWDAVTWRAALDHQLSDNLLVYASANSGFKSGSFNATAPADPALNPETIYAYEIGLKSDLLDRTVRINASAFYYDYEDIQLQIVTGTGTAALTAPKGRLKGLDVELVWAPEVATGSLEIRGGAAFLDAQYRDFPNAPLTVPRDPSVAPFGGNLTISGDATGHKMVRSPDFSSTVALDYTVPVSDSLVSRLNLTWQHMGEFYWEVDNRLRQPSYDVLNAQVALLAADESWQVKFWTRNLLDEAYSVVVNSSVFGDSASSAAPRSYGVTLEKSFAD